MLIAQKHNQACYKKANNCRNIHSLPNSPNQQKTSATTAGLKSQATMFNIFTPLPVLNPTTIFTLLLFGVLTSTLLFQCGCCRKKKDRSRRTAGGKPVVTPNAHRSLAKKEETACLDRTQSYNSADKIDDDIHLSREPIGPKEIPRGEKESRIVEQNLKKDVKNPKLDPYPTIAMMLTDPDQTD